MAKNRVTKARKPAPPSDAPRAAPLAFDRARDHPYFYFKHVDTSTKEQYKFALSEAEAKELVEFACKMAGQSWRDIEQMSTGGKKRRPLHHDQAVATIEACAQRDLNRLSAPRAGSASSSRRGAVRTRYLPDSCFTEKEGPMFGLDKALKAPGEQTARAAAQLPAVPFDIADQARKGMEEGIEKVTEPEKRKG